MAISNYSSECFKKCPELQACAAEYILRHAAGEDIDLDIVISDHINDGTLPKTCEKGPINKGVGLLSSKAIMSEVAVGSTVKIDAWGDLASIRCRAQGDMSGGTIRPI